MEVGRLACGSPGSPGREGAWKGVVLGLAWSSQSLCPLGAYVLEGLPDRISIHNTIKFQVVISPVNKTRGERRKQMRKTEVQREAADPGSS